MTSLRHGNYQNFKKKLTNNVNTFNYDFLKIISMLEKLKNAIKNKKLSWLL